MQLLIWILFLSLSLLEESEITLGKRDLAYLLRLLQSYSYKWNLIGLSLGFTPHELYTISSKVTLLTGAPVSYLQELLSQWVQWPTTDHPTHPTVRALCTALRSSPISLGLPPSVTSMTSTVYISHTQTVYIHGIIPIALLIPSSVWNTCT